MKMYNNLKIQDKAFTIVVVLSLLFVLSVRMFINGGSDNGFNRIVLVGGKKIQVKIADQDNERYQGLSGVNKLAFERGELFIHQEPGRYEYVMRDMNFDLDFIFINGDKVVDIAKNVNKDFDGVVQGAVDYDKILEVSAGWVDKNYIKLDDTVVVK